MDGYIIYINYWMNLDDIPNLGEMDDHGPSTGEDH